MSNYLINTYKVSERRACKVVELPRSTHRSRPCQDKCRELTAEIVRLSYAYSRFGYRKIHTLLINAGWHVSRETVRLIRKREGLQVRKKQQKKRLLERSTTELQQAQYPNHVWSYDFVFDQTTDGRTLKHLTVVDEFTHEGLMIYINRSITATGFCGEPSTGVKTGGMMMPSSLWEWTNIRRQVIGTYFLCLYS